MSVRAFQPRSIDPPHFVAETLDDLADMVGGFVGAEQCDGCGNSTYRLEALPGHLGTVKYIARCAVDFTDDPEFRHTDPCGTPYPINLWDDDLVVF